MTIQSELKPQLVVLLFSLLHCEAISTIIRQDGFGYSGVVSSTSLQSPIAMKEYSQWPSGFTMVSGAFAGAAYDTTTSSIWLVPYNSSQIIRFNKATSTMTTFAFTASGFTKGPGAFYGGFHDGTFLWLIPMGADRVIKFNTVTLAQFGYLYWPAGSSRGPNPFRGCVYDGTTLFLIPNSMTHLVSIATNGGMTGYNAWPTGFMKQYYAFSG
eukprot:PhF_6_TR11299/c0_g1_i2/m.18235